MAKKRKGLSKTKRLRKNIKATIRRREAQGWQFDPLDLATVESGNYQQLKSLQRDNYRKLYEHATVTNPETGQKITGRQAQIRGRWKGGMWQDQMPEPDLYWENIVWNNIKSMYGLRGVKDELLAHVENMIQGLIDRYGENVILKRMSENASSVNRLVQLYVMYFDPLTGKTNGRQGDPMILQELRQLLDPNVSLEDLEAYSDMEEEWEDIE